MKPKFTSKRWEVVFFAGFYVIKWRDSGERIGGLYPHYDEAERELIKLERKYLGIE